MTGTRTNFWDIAYGVVLVIALAAAAFHAFQGRWAQAVLALIAAGVGSYLLYTGWGRTEPAPRARTRDLDVEESQPSIREDAPRFRDDSGRYADWLPAGTISGFVATGIMTAAVLAAYAFSYIVGSTADSANQLRVWFAALVDNTVTEIALVNLPIAIGIHLVAGIVWAIIYAGFVEQRLSGSGLQRGVKFALIPWVLSVVVFFPVVGAGILGLDIGAGLLPVLGNLILHIIYGGTLGKVYESQSVWKEAGTPISSSNTDILAAAQRATAIGLVPGALLGLLVGLVGSSVLTPEAGLLMSGVLGALVGSAVGVWIGSLTGLSSADTGHPDRQET